VSKYVFDAAWQREHDRLHGLEELFDGSTTARLAALGVTEGWRCLEVGVGAGSVALWLASRVGPRGHILATDLDLRFVEDHGRPNLDVVRHDILTDPLEEASFDLVHARALVEHLPERSLAVARMISALRPGGRVVLEDVDVGGAAPDALSRYVRPPELAPLLERVYRAAGAVYSTVGADAGFGAALPMVRREAGLESVGAEVHTPLILGGGKGDWVRLTIEQLQVPMCRGGLVTEEEVQRFLELTAGSGACYPPPIMVTAWGSRPGP
jgi:SAM-dependent methyltransferase